MALIALKPCSFGGVTYLKGEEVPYDAVVNAEVQKKYGVLAESNAESKAVLGAKAVFNVPVDDGSGKFTSLPVSEETLQSAAKVMQMSADNAVKAVADISDNDCLILINALDSRKAVKKATSDRGKALEGADTEAAAEVKGDTAEEG